MFTLFAKYFPIFFQISINKKEPYFRDNSLMMFFFTSKFLMFAQLYILNLYSLCIFENISGWHFLTMRNVFKALTARNSK
jgi:hypothetical protein